MYIADLVNLTTKAWALPILASFHAGTPGRQAALLSATGASRGAFVQSLTHLTQTGLVERNPGHGHPLRPEFRLTPAGEKAAALAARLEAICKAQHTPILRRVWTLPVLSAAHRPVYFSDIRQNLRPVSDRALSQSLKALEAEAWIARHVELATRPPRPSYIATNIGAQLSETLAAHIQFSTA